MSHTNSLHIKTNVWKDLLTLCIEDPLRTPSGHTLAASASACLLSIPLLFEAFELSPEIVLHLSVKTKCAM